MNYRKSRNLMWMGFAVGILIMLIGISFENETTTCVFAFVGAIVFFASLIQAFIFYNCPYCKYSLMNVKGEIPNHCPECGAELKEK